MNGLVTEQSLIQALVQGLARSPLQRNCVHASDAEIIVIPGCDDVALAVTTDVIVEEIASGLYADPSLAGWMAVMANMSDLAAVGAEPLGMLVAQTLPRETAQGDVALLGTGIRDALAACSSFLLGGDTNIADRLMLSGTALGVLPAAERLSRIGCRPGDLLYASGLLGSGNAYAAARLTGASSVPSFRPVARLREGRALRDIASSCMDTSDGVLATLDQLSQLNGVGFCITDGWEQALEGEARAAMSAQSLPEWLLLAGCHGEFELLFTVPRDRNDRLREVAAQIDWRPVLLGAVTAGCAVTMPLHGATVVLDTGRIRGLWDASDGDVRQYLHGLLAMDAAL